MSFRGTVLLGMLITMILFWGAITYASHLVIS